MHFGNVDKDLTLDQTIHMLSNRIKETKQLNTKNEGERENTLDKNESFYQGGCI